MYKINPHYAKLQGSYLFSAVAQKQHAFSEAHPDREVIRLSIGDVTQPLAPAVIAALHDAVDQIARTAAEDHGLRLFYGFGKSLFPVRCVIRFEICSAHLFLPYF